MRPIAIYLPQYHPIPENDEWWEKGFTEWTNVVKAKPLFPGHYQPHLPSDLGFYDLRLAQSRQAQVDLAKEYGIYGFCYYHYWFNGKRLLEQPLDEVVDSGKPDFPFMVCWANENWTRTWDGFEHNVLMKQEYSIEDDKTHIEFLIRSYFNDKRYISVEGKPFFVIYRPQLFPNIKETIKIWREKAEEAGLKGLYIGYVQSFGFKGNPEDFGFDCAIEFQPDFTKFPEPKRPTYKERILRKLGISESPVFRNRIYNYEKIVDILMKNAVESKEGNIYKSVSPGWDNSARKKSDAIILDGSTPAIFKKWLKKLYLSPEILPLPEKYIFINAWNEWAEGNHLEPDQKWGLSYLKALKEALTEND